MNTDVHNGDKIWNSLFINVFIINFMAHICLYAMNTLTGKYADSLGATAAIVGFASSAFAITALVFKMISAPAIDTFNRKYVLMGSLAVLVVSFTGYTISNNVTMLVISRLLQGVGMAFTTTCCLTIASDSLPHKKMSSGVGIFALGTALAQSIAPTIGLEFMGVLGYNKTFFIFTGIMLIAFLYAATMKINFTRTNTFKISISSMIAKEAIPPACIIFLLSFAYCNINAFLVLFAETRGINANIGYFFTVYALTMLLTRPMIGRLADKFGTIKVIIPGFCCFILSFLLISNATSLPMFLIAAFISAFGYGGCTPAIQAVAMKSVPKHRRGAASCTSYIGTDLGHFGAVLAGLLVERYGYVSMWRLMTIPVFIAVGVALAFRKRITHAGEEFIK